MSLPRLDVAGGRIERFFRDADPRQLNPVVFAIASLVAAGFLLGLILIPQHLSKEARWDVLRAHVGEIARLAAANVDGDLHRQLLDPANYTQELYNRALKPLVRFHSADPDIFYLYTMVQKNDGVHFVLDTAASPELKTKHQLEASAYMERFDLRPEYEDDWLQQIASGKTYVTPEFETDDYGTFLSGHSAIYDSQGRYSGFVGVDFDVAYYLAEESRFSNIRMASIAAALPLSLLIGYLIALHDSQLRRRMEEHYQNSIHDDLSGLPNRRGAMIAVRQLLDQKRDVYAMLLLDITNLKLINNLQGYTAGDAVIIRVAEAIVGAVRDGDVYARLGGDEFMVFAPQCDAAEASRIASQILAKLSKRELPLASAPVRAAIGIAVCSTPSCDFAQIYQAADTALYFARIEEATRIAVFDPAMTEAIKADREKSAAPRRGSTLGRA